MKCFAFSFKCAAVIAAIAVAVFTAKGEQKGLLILQCGSDWCESGEDVRRVFEGSAFRRALGGRFDFAVYDDMDEPTEKVKAENGRLEGLRVESRRFPAITCLTGEPRRFFAQIENIPFNIKAADLAGRIVAATKAKDKAERLFEKGDAKNPGKLAAAYGQAFAAMAEHTGEHLEKRLREGNVAWKDKWDALVKADAGDRFGWKFRFEAGAGIDIVKQASKFRTDGDMAGGEQYIASLRSIPTNAMTLVQRQAVEIAEYALWRKTASRAEANKIILRRTLEMGRDTVWGPCALGYLRLSGEKIERRKPPAGVATRSRPRMKSTTPAPFLLSRTKRAIAAIAPGDALNQRMKSDIARYAVLRRIGEKGWNALAARPGARPFIRRFFSDRAWMEDFAWSGGCEDWPAAILALESLVYQDGRRWIKGDNAPPRRFATAVALMCPRESEEWFADVLDSFRTTAKAKRLHPETAVQPVWRWRYGIAHLTHARDSYRDFVNSRGGTPEEYPEPLWASWLQRYLDAYSNVRWGRYSTAHHAIPYRMFNCFGESIHSPEYNRPWRAAGEWLHRRWTPIVGGVCGELSTFGSMSSNAHGLPAVPVGQPRHCAYVRRLKDGTWEINNSVNFGTGFHSILPFRDSYRYTYCQAHEGTFEGDREKRHDADRFLELAHLAESNGSPAEEVAAFFGAAHAAWPTHYIAWRHESEWIERSRRPLAGHRDFAYRCVSALKGWRQPLWDILSVYFSRVAKEAGAVSLAGEIAHFAPLLRQSGEKLAEEGDFRAALASWLKPLENDAALKEKALFTVISTQFGTPDYFAQVLSGCADFIVSDEKRSERFIAFLGSQPTRQGINLSGLILAASRKGNIAAFRQLAAIQDKISPVKRTGKSYPMLDFGAKLLSADGLISGSTTSPWDRPALYPRAIDDSPPDGNILHTNKEKSPWAMVILPGESVIKGVVVENKCPYLRYRNRMVPLEIQISADGADWTTVYEDGELRETYRADLRGNAGLARRIRVRRKPDAKDDCFHVTKILVYGDKMY